MEEYHLQEEDIVNKSYFEDIRNIITCIICLNIVEDPVQCQTCQHSFCLECINKLGRCPMGCSEFKFILSQLCNELLSGIKVKCYVCHNEMNYNNIKKHIDEDCTMINFKERYLKLKEEYNRLKEELNNPKEFNDIKNTGSIKINVHKHPIKVMKHFQSSWICDVCETSFNDSIPTYNCTLCDFDACYNCVKDKITMGTIDENLKIFFNDKNDDKNN